MWGNLVGAVCCFLSAALCLITAGELQGMREPHYPHGFVVVCGLMGVTQFLHGVGLMVSFFGARAAYRRQVEALEAYYADEYQTPIIPYPGPRKGG